MANLLEASKTKNLTQVSAVIPPLRIFGTGEIICEGVTLDRDVYYTHSGIMTDQDYDAWGDRIRPSSSVEQIANIMSQRRSLKRFALCLLKRLLMSIALNSVPALSNPIRVIKNG